MKRTEKEFWEYVYANAGKYWDHPDVDEECPGNYGEDEQHSCMTCPYKSEKTCTIEAKAGLNWCDWDNMVNYAADFLGKPRVEHRDTMIMAAELLVRHCGDLQSKGCTGCPFKRKDGCFFKEAPSGYFFEENSVWKTIIDRGEGRDHICGIIPEEIQ